MIQLIQKSIDLCIEKKEKIYLILLAVSLSSMLICTTTLVSSYVFDFGPKVYNLLGKIRHLTYVGFIILFGADFLRGKVKRILSLAVLFLGFISTYFSKDFQIFSYILIVVTAVNVDIKKILKVYFAIHGAVLTIVVLLGGSGILYDMVFDAKTRQRHTMGFMWVTTPMAMLLTMIMIVAYIKREEVKIEQICLMLIAAFGLFYSTDAKFFLVLQIVVMICIISYRYGKKLLDRLLLSKPVNWILMALPWLMCALAMVVTYMYNPENAFMAKLNTVLNRRLKLGKSAIEEYGFTPFGQQIKWIGYGVGTKITKDTKYNYVDSSYVQITLCYGVVIMFIVLLAYCIMMKKSAEKKDTMLIIILSVLLLMGLTEPRLINIMYNPFIISFQMLFEKGIEREQYGNEV